MKIFKILLFFCLLLSYSCKQEITQERLTVCFTGDVLLDRGVRAEIERRKSSADFLFEDVSKIFKSSDATIINLECPLTDTVTPINKRFIFRGEPIWASSLKRSGVTHAVLANNHSMDQGRKGLIATNRHLTNAGIQSLGYGENQTEACKPVFISKDSIEIAVFSCVRLPLENWVILDEQPGVCQISIENLCESIKCLKEKKPNCHIIIVLHWGLEYQRHPVIAQRKDARLLINAGADAIIGHHPHVIQDEEIYNGKPIFYSLGNFVFDQNKPYTNRGLIVQLIFDKKGLSYKKYPVTIKRCKPYL